MRAFAVTCYDRRRGLALMAALVVDAGTFKIGDIKEMWGTLGAFGTAKGLRHT